MRIKNYKYSNTLLIALIIFINSSCGKTPNDARKELGQMNIEYSNDSLCERIKNNDILAVKLFLLAGIDINKPNKDKLTPLMIASGYGHNDIVTILLNKGADIKKKGVNGKSSLHLANKPEIVKLLIDKGADVNIEDNKGWTPLLSASTIQAQKYGADLITVLIANGADINAKSFKGVTALMVAAQENQAVAVEILLKNGAIPNIVADDGSTALMLAALRGNKYIVELLLKKGADLNAGNKIIVKQFGITALQFLEREGRDRETIDMIKKAVAR